MRDDRRRALVLVAAVGALAVAVLLIVWVISGEVGDVSKRVAVVGAVLGIFGAVSPVVLWAWRQRRRAGSGVSTPAQVEAAADLLAARTLASWSRELVRRGIEAPAPVRVRWGWGGDDVALPRGELASSPALSTDPGPLPADATDRVDKPQVLNSGLVTRLHDEVYVRLRHGRLVLIGGAGAGKIGAMMLLLVEALKHREQTPGPDRSAVPVPVWLTLGSWDPTTRGLREWVIATMGRDRPYLRADEFGPDAIGQLFDTARIALFVDGLDEMPDTHRGRAVEALTAETAGLRVTLTSRPDQYRATLDAGRQLPYTAVVELHPVGPQAAARYLLDGQIGSAREAWRQVTDQLQADPDGVLARTLNTPLTLSLARSAYAGADPTELLTADLDTEPALRGHLLDQVLLTAYPDPKRRSHATYWLGWIAYQMNTQTTGPTRDLRWWDVPTWVACRSRQYLGALLGGLVYMVVLLLIFVILFALGDVGDLLSSLEFLVALVVGLLVGLVVALVVGHSGGIPRSAAQRRPTPQKIWQGPNKFVGGLLFGLGGAPAVLLLVDLDAESLAIWLVTGSVGGVVFGLVVGRSSRRAAKSALPARAPSGSVRGAPRRHRRPSCEERATD